LSDYIAVIEKREKLLKVKWQALGLAIFNLKKADVMKVTVV
jgi:hypothetical protein